MVAKMSHKINVKQIRKQTIPEKIIRELQTLIDSGEIVPGNKLPGEREFAKMLNVSRPSLREALKTLSLLGILENRPGSGTYLATSSAKAPIEPFSIILSIKKGAILEILEARESLEGTVAELAAQRRTDKDLRVLEKAIEEMSTCFKMAEKYSLHEIEFHKAVIGAAKNSVIADLMEKVYKLLIDTRNVVRRYSSDTYSYIVQDYHNHEVIFKHIKAGNAHLARKEMIEHMQILKQGLVDQKKDID